MYKVGYFLSRYRTAGGTEEGNPALIDRSGRKASWWQWTRGDDSACAKVESQVAASCLYGSITAAPLFLPLCLTGNHNLTSPSTPSLMLPRVKSNTFGGGGGGGGEGEHMHSGWSLSWQWQVTQSNVKNPNPVWSHPKYRSLPPPPPPPPPLNAVSVPSVLTPQPLVLSSLRHS